VVGAVGTFIATRTAVRDESRDDRARVAGYLDRIAAMLTEMADDLKTKRASPARCAEPVEAIGNAEQVVQKSWSAYGLQNDLLVILTDVMDVPSTYSRAQAQSRKLMLEDLLKSGNDLSGELDDIRRASGMFEGAAEAIKAR
jgi:hypothetical protein